MFGDSYEQSYKILGRGSIGTVYLVRNVDDDIDYAAKIINTQENYTEKQQKMILNQLQKLNQFKHPTLIEFKEINYLSITDSKKLQLSIITRYMKKGSLRSIIDLEKHSKDFNATKKYKILLGITDSMRFLHKNKLFHFNLKPENILIDESYNSHICDFGLYQIFTKKFEENRKLTLKGEMGNPIFIAPELLRGEEDCGEKVDVYSFAIIAYELITGNSPLGQIPPIEIPQRILSNERPEFPEEFQNENISNLISQCWNDDPDERPSFDEIFEILKQEKTYSNGKINKREIKDYLAILENVNNNSINNDSNHQNINTQNKKFKTNICINLFFFILIFAMLIYFLSYFTLNDNSCLSKVHKNAIIKIKLIYYDFYKIIISKWNSLISFLVSIINEREKIFNITKNHFIKSFQQIGQNGYDRIKSSYLTEIDFSNDYQKSIKYYNKSEEYGESYPIDQIGYFFIRTNYKDSVNYFLQPQHQKTYYGLSFIGYCYYTGKEIEQNYTKAVDYFQRAANFGFSDAFIYLGIAHEDGNGVDQNFTKSREYYERAANLGNSNALIHLALLYRDGKGVKQNFTKSIGYYEQAAKKGNKYVNIHLGIAYEKGIEVDQNYKKAFECYHEAARLKNSYGYINMGIAYEKGKGIEQNYFKAIECYQNAVNLDNSYGLIHLGLMYEDGKGVEKNFMKAFEYYKKAADHGSLNGLIFLALAYEEGKGVAQDYKKAFYYYEQATKLHNHYPFIMVGKYYEDGRGVKEKIQILLIIIKKKLNLIAHLH